VLLHVLGHVETHHGALVVEQELGERPGRFRLAHACRAEEDERSGRLLRVRQAFRPELLNRIDEIIVFDPLTEDDLVQIIELLLGDVRERMADRKVGLELTDEAKSALVREGYDPVFGARPLRRTIERRVANPLSRRILAAEFTEGDTALVGYQDGDYTFEKQDQRISEPATA